MVSFDGPRAVQWHWTKSSVNLMDSDSSPRESRGGRNSTLAGQLCVKYYSHCFCSFTLFLSCVSYLFSLFSAKYYSLMRNFKQILNHSIFISASVKFLSFLIYNALVLHFYLFNMQYLHKCKDRQPR